MQLRKLVSRTVRECCTHAVLTAGTYACLQFRSLQVGTGQRSLDRLQSLDGQYADVLCSHLWQHHGQFRR